MSNTLHSAIPYVYCFRDLPSFHRRRGRSEVAGVRIVEILHYAGFWYHFRRDFPLGAVSTETTWLPVKREAWSRGGLACVLALLDDS